MQQSKAEPDWFRHRAQVFRVSANQNPDTGRWKSTATIHSDEGPDHNIRTEPVQRSWPDEETALEAARAWAVRYIDRLLDGPLKSL